MTFLIRRHFLLAPAQDFSPKKHELFVCLFSRFEAFLAHRANGPLSYWRDVSSVRPLSVVRPSVLPQLYFGNGLINIAIILQEASQGRYPGTILFVFLLNHFGIFGIFFAVFPCYGMGVFNMGVNGDLKKIQSCGQIKVTVS